MESEEQFSLESTGDDLRVFGCITAEGEKLYTAQAQVTAAHRLRRETLDGREYAVAPVTPIVAGVLNGRLVPSDEIAAFVDAWNGRPVPVRHPEKGGAFLSANSPEVIGQAVIGQFFNAKMVGDRLKGELWLDTAKVQALGGEAAALLERLDAGQPVEVSTGYFCKEEPAQGVFNGRQYAGIHRELRPDHIALLPDEVGACSLADGCGANVNKLRVHAAEDGYKNSVMVAFYLRDEDAQALALDGGELPAGGRALEARELHVTLGYYGDLEEMGADFSMAASALAEYARFAPVVMASVGGLVRFFGPATDAPPGGGAGEQDALALALDGEELHRFRRRLVEHLYWALPVEVSRPEGYIPHVTLAYGPADAELTIFDAAAEMRGRRLVFDAVALAWGDQVVTFKLLGEVRAMKDASCGCKEEQVKDKEKGAGAPEQDKVVTEVTANNEGGAEEISVEPGAVEKLVIDAVPGGEVGALMDVVRELGGVQVVREALLGIQAQSRRVKDELVSQLAANQRCAFGKDELAGMSVDVLEKLERSLRPADYAGRGGVRVHSDQDEEWGAYVAPTEGK